jgi:hypothetical protein
MKRPDDHGIVAIGVIAMAVIFVLLCVALARTA